VPIDEVPRNAIGKVSRALLRRWIDAHFDLIERPRPALHPKQSGAGGG